MHGRSAHLVFMFLAIALITACSGEDSSPTETGGQAAPATESSPSFTDVSQTAVETESTQTEADTRSPEEIAEAYMKASAAMDQETLNALHTVKARDGLEAMERQTEKIMQSALSDFEAAANSDPEEDSTTVVAGELHTSAGFPDMDYEIGEAVVDGETAIVSVNSQIGDEFTQEVTLRMRKESEGWRVYGTDTTVGEMSVNIDYEKLASSGDLMAGLLNMEEGSPLNEMMNELTATLEVNQAAGGSPGEIAATRAGFDAVRVMDQDAFSSSWINQESFESDSVGTAIESLAASIGLELSANQDRERLKVPVEVQVAGLSRLEALEKLSAQVGLFPEYPFFAS